MAKADFNSDSRGGRASGFINDIEYPVEDVGILFSGTINDHKGEKSVSDIEIMLAINDTLGNVICGHSDDNGHFTLLTNEWGTTEGYFTVYKRGVPLTNGYRIKMDPKFFYRGNEEIPGSDTPYHANNDFLEEMQEEAKRVLIEKAYNQNGHGFYNTITDSSMFPVGSFYVKPEIVVYPGIFFYLPNFEEIAREILPRVRYRHNKNGCELTVFHLEDNIQSTNPLVLVDGIPLDDPCDLYSLDSDDINRIEIQSGMRVSGNLVYNGLLAIYTTPKYRRGESKIPGKSVSIVLGYSNMPENFVYSLKEDDLEEERIPEFKNQLYWNPQLTIGEDSKAEFEFFTSDEEGSFMIEISGFDRKGYPIALKRIIQVKED